MLRWLVLPARARAVSRASQYMMFLGRNEARCFGLFLSWTLSQSSSVLVDFVRENVVVAAKHGRLSGAHFEPIHAPTSARTPPPASMRPPSAHCMGIVCKGSNIDCPYFEGAAARSRKTSADQRKSGKVVRWGR